MVVEDATSQVTPERLHDLRLIGVNVTDVASVEKELTGA
ncbi:Hypothetical isochorismatase hydrolase [Mycobacteroides abscessus subsp. abscessus]|nr:Hypothetical isochorismatase hydrolase [Mycobacteroides abscessus subsp. abscessus]